MKKLAVLISASLAMVSTATLAEVYVGGKVGTTWLDDACISGAACDDDGGITFGGYAGYQAFSWLGFELGYDYLGSFTGAGLDDNSVSAITLAPRISIPFTDTFSIYGKFGGAWVDYGSKDDYSYLGAAGIELNASKKVSVRLEYQAITDINNDLIRAQANTVSLGLSYKFGGADEEPMVEPVPMVEEAPAPAPEPAVVTKTYPPQSLNSSSFANNSAVLTPEANAQLDTLVSFMNEHPESTVTFTGYTDSAGAAEYNLGLSEKRAQAAADSIMAKGIDESRITVKGEGEANPIATNSTPEGRAQNRRVEIYVPEFDYQVQE